MVALRIPINAARGLGIVSTDEFSSSQVKRFNSLLAEYRDQRLRGDAPSIDEFASRHPELEQELKAKLELEEASVSDATIVFDDSKTPDAAAGPPNDQATQVFDSSKLESGSVGSGVQTTSSPVEFHEELQVGDTVGGYRLESELGRGGMGVVYEAEHIDNGRRVAIKLLSADLNRTDETVERFLKEASLAASLSHPRSTFVYEAGQDGTHFYTVMELMPGRTLNDLVKEDGPLPITQAVDYILDAVDGLEAAHGAGIVHRDVKPSNCFLTEESRVKIGDFGLSKSLVSDSSLTMTGMFLGTPQFAAPEQIRHQGIDERTDIYALATSLYYLITGKPPFVGGASAVLAQIVADDPPSLRSLRRDAPKSLGKVIRRGMHKDPKKRFQTMADLRAALLPFSSRSSFGAIGLRMAAIGLDISMLYILAFPVTAFCKQILETWFVSKVEDVMLFAPISMVHLALMIPYFTILEGLTGRTFGKWMFGLRVMPDGGERPGLVRALIRSILLPGLSFSLITIWRDVLTGDVFVSQIGNLEMDPKQALGMMLATAMQAGALGLMCVTMRRSNGYRGVHELLSSTYVSQPATTESEVDVPHMPIAYSVVDSSLPDSIGTYKIVGRIGERNGVEVFEGVDDSLGRRVWLYTSDAADAIRLPPSRTSNVRPSRPRWLQGGHDNGQHWFAVEAVKGVPLTHLDSLPWARGRDIVAATAREMAACTNDESLPKDLGPQHLWIDAGGGIKVIDFPWLLADTDSHDPLRDDPAADLFAVVVDKCCRGREATGGAHDLRIELAVGQAPDYSHAATTVEVPWNIGWRDRLSLLMVTMAVEFMPLFAIGGGAGVLVGKYFGFHSLFVAQWVALSIALIPVWIMAAKLKEGGLALRLCEMELRSLSGARPSVFQRLWRATLIWTPLLIPVVALMTLEPWSKLGGIQSNTPEGGRFVWITLLAAWAGIFLSVFFGIGALKSVRRNVQDLLSGTYLVRK